MVTLSKTLITLGMDMTKIGIGVVGGGYMGKAHSVAMAAVGAVFDTKLRPVCRQLQPPRPKARNAIAPVMATKCCAELA